METRNSVKLTATVACAILYAVGCYITSYIVSPWGVGQFRPAVVIPSLFAVIFGAWPAGVGAAIGTLIADSANYGGFHIGSLIAAVPGNFLGFYLMGWYLEKKFTWSRFITASIATLVFANLVVAVLYVGVFMNLFEGGMPALGASGMTVFIVGLTVWWFVTMLPFVVVLTPPLIRGVAKAFPSMMDNEKLDEIVSAEVSGRELALSMVSPGVIMIVLALSVSYTGLGIQLEGLFGTSARSLIEIMSYISGAILGVLGLYFYVQAKES